MVATVFWTTVGLRVGCAWLLLVALAVAEIGVRHINAVRGLGRAGGPGGVATCRNAASAATTATRRSPWPAPPASARVPLDGSAGPEVRDRRPAPNPRPHQCASTAPGPVHERQCEPDGQIPPQHDPVGQNGEIHTPELGAGADPVRNGNRHTFTGQPMAAIRAGLASGTACRQTSARARPGSLPGWDQSGKVRVANDG